MLTLFAAIGSLIADYKEKLLNPVLRQNSVRAENSATPSRDGCPIQVIPSPSSCQESVPGNPRGIPVYIRMEEPGRFHDAKLVRIRQLVRSGSAALPVAHEQGRDLRLWCEFFRPVFPSRVRDVCGPRSSSECTPRGDVSGGVRQLQ
jgi:hypothetical protein